MKRKGRHNRGLSKFAAGAIGIVVIALFSYGAYTKFANPFANNYTIHAVFSSANGLQPGSFVRIAGVNVGTVNGVSTVPGCHSASRTPAACQAADVSMTIDSNGLPIHKDATFAIRPRIFLEGNFFVDLSPGTPSAPDAPSGYTFPIQQGIEQVQLDQVLTSLQAGTRANLQTLLQQYGKAVYTSAPSFNRSVQYWLPAYQYTALVAHDALGIEPNDLSNYLAAQGTTAAALNAHPQTLQSLITDFNTTANAFARENVALRNSVVQLPRALSAAIPAFNSLNAAFPPLERLAVSLIPGVKSTGPTIDASLPFITQLRLLVQPSELQGLAEDLSKTVPSLAKLTNETIPLMKNEVRPASSCVANIIYPWSQLTVPDPNFNASNGFPPRPVYVEAVDYLPGLAGESRNFDANGPYIRVLLNGGTFTYSLSPGLFGQSLEQLKGAQPAVPPGGKRPPYKETVPCETQAPITNLAAPQSAPFQQINTTPPSSIPLAARKTEIKQALSLIESSAHADGLKVNVPKGLP
jgi:phospholipid/cholesterol/gamma-HCH transport system substrate-binding protein